MIFSVGCLLAFSRIHCLFFGCSEGKEKMPKFLFIEISFVIESAVKFRYAKDDSVEKLPVLNKMYFDCACIAAECRCAEMVFDG